MSTLRTELRCIVGGRETPHAVHYVGRRIARVACEACGHTIALERIVERYTRDVAHRLLTKPARMTGEVRRDLGRFLISLPARAVTKPLRVAREVSEAVGELLALRTGRTA